MLLSKTCLNLTRSISRKVAEISPRHQRNKDEKLMFGGVLETKVEKKKRERRQTKEKLPLSSRGSLAPDSEAFWLETVSKSDLKVYRKTSTGRYKEVDKDKLLEKLNQEKKPQKIVLPNIIVKKLTSAGMLTSEDTPNWVSSELEKRNFPAVTKVLSETMSDASRAALERWKQNMIAELGEEGFVVFNKGKLFCLWQAILSPFQIKLVRKTVFFCRAIIIRSAISPLRPPIPGKIRPNNRQRLGTRMVQRAARSAQHQRHPAPGNARPPRKAKIQRRYRLRRIIQVHLQ